jgi:Ala-tRNA(Pro) deacylase
MEITISASSSPSPSTMPNALAGLLEQMGIPHDVIWHKVDFSAQQTAHDTHTPRTAFAKVVVAAAGEQEVMLVLPANHDVVLERVAEAMGTPTACLVSEQRLAELFPDCEIGAQPPFGAQYGLPVLVAAPLALDERITFNAGTHACAFRMRYADYERMERPRVVDFSLSAGTAS